MKDRKPATPAAGSDPSTMQPSTMQRRKASGTLGPDIQAKIGKQLRAYYDGLIEPTPDRFVDLLRKLDKTGGKGSSE
jgi:hypothetical protein